MRHLAFCFGVWMFNMYISILNFCSHMSSRIRHRRWNVGYVMSGRGLEPGSSTDRYSAEVLGNIHKLFSDVCPFNDISGNCGLHNTAVHKMKLMFCVYAIRGTGEIPFLEDDWVAKWVRDAYTAHEAGMCEDGEFPEESEPGVWETYCPFCTINDELENDDAD